MWRSILAVAIAAISTGCVSRELMPCSSAPPVLNRFGSSTGRSVAVLKSAERLEGSHLGPMGVPSCVVAAYRHVLRQPHAAATFEKLLEQSTPAGKIYALAGLYDTDRTEFVRLIANVETSSPAMFEQLDTCIGSRPTRDEVFAKLRAGDLSASWRPLSP